MFRAIEESNLSDITKKNYMHTIEKLEVALNAHLIDILQNPEKYIQEIDRLYPKESSLRTLYATIMSVFKYDRDLKKILMEEYDIWMDRFNELNNKYKTNLKMNMPTAEQREKDIGYSDFKSKMDEMPHGSDERLLLCMYTYLPPKRADYGAVKIYMDVIPRKHESNYILLKNTGGLLYIGEHKTSATNGAFIQPIPHELLLEIIEHLQYKPNKKYLFEDVSRRPFQSKHAFGSWVSQKFKNIFGKHLTINSIRHSFINSLDFNKMSIYEKEKIANDMGHSVMVQDNYRLFM